MSGSFFEKLKYKPKPEPPKIVTVVVQAPAKRVNITDKRGEGKINRETILKEMKMPKIRQERQRGPSPVPETKPEPEPKLEPEPEPETKPEPELIPIIIRKKKGKRKKKIIEIEAEEDIVIGKLIKPSILPRKKPNVLVRAPHYYLNNRQIFVNKINELFSTYREEILRKQEETVDEGGEDIMVESCNKGSTMLEFELLTHQKIVRDYLNLYTPYRGLLLYHGLGSGKTCTSIAVAEGMKSAKKIIVMTPASLQRNYVEQLKECGDPMYVKNQFWKFVSLKSNEHLLDELSAILSIPKSFIREKQGAWMVNVNNEPNYESLSSQDKNRLNVQLNKMISAKYTFINYNGLRTKKLDEISDNGKINPFDGAVVIIDEAHNFISRIVNKIKKPESLSMRLYEFLMSAEKARIVLLSGTPIINYPNEIGILFNILRGYIKTWSMPLNVKTKEKVNEAVIKKLLTGPSIRGAVDYIDYKPSTKMLKVTRNPFGFESVNKGRSYKGVHLNILGDVTDEEVINDIQDTLSKNGIEVIRTGMSVNRYKALPDVLDEFQQHFVNIKTGEIKNKKLFQRRILGLVSYFPDIKELMPSFDKEKDITVLNIPMSDYQFGVYESARVQERKIETRNSRKKARGGKNGVYEDSVSTYRIFSRAFCNFVFPRTISRPMPQDGADITATLEGGDEDILDALSVQDRLENSDGRFLADEKEGLDSKKSDDVDQTYDARIKTALKTLKTNATEFLSPKALATYSPKFLSMYENIISTENVGLHMIYSQFRTLEGIGIFSLILEANGFTRFKLKKDTATGVWGLDMTDEELAKPTFALYTGTEDNEEKEIIRNIYNSDWGLIPTAITDKLKSISSSNIMGDIIKVLMITASGAEGISLKNCRFVHITEPYWHPVRMEQVIGRAARICSHKDLPPDLRNIKVFLYLMTFSKKQLTSDDSIELRLKDKSKLDKKTPLTSDEALYEISNIKNGINKRILLAMKEAAFDCALHYTKKSTEPLVCFNFGKTEPSTSKFAIMPSLSGEEDDTISQINVKKITWAAREINIKGNLFALKEDTQELYDYDTYKQAMAIPGIEPTLVGKLIKNKDGGFNVELNNG